MSIDAEAIQNQEDSDREAERFPHNPEKREPSNQELARRYARMREPFNVNKRLELEDYFAKAAEANHGFRQFLLSVLPKD